MTQVFFLSFLFYYVILFYFIFLSGKGGEPFSKEEKFSFLVYHMDLLVIV